MQPRIAKIEAIQASQDADIKILRERSANLVERWYRKDIIGAGEEWANVESRVEVVEQKVRRAERAKERDNDLI